MGKRNVRVIIDMEFETSEPRDSFDQFDASSIEDSVRYAIRSLGVFRQYAGAKKEKNVLHEIHVSSLVLVGGGPTIGHKFKGHDGKVYLCDSYEPRYGYWMTEDGNLNNRRNVSERAIDTTFHRV
jgi:hypothetical protein